MNSVLSQTALTVLSSTVGHYHLQKQDGYFGEVNVSTQIPAFRLHIILDKPLNPVKFCFF